MLRAALPVAALRGLLHSSSRGSALIEFALALPLLVLLLVGLFDLGLGFYQALQVQGAAAAGAEYATLHRWNVTNITNAIQSATKLGTDVKAIPAPSKLCGCTDGNIFTPMGTYNATADTCSNDGTGGSCSAALGLYASVSAQLQYSPILPYPGLADPLVLAGHAYRRLH